MITNEIPCFGYSLSKTSPNTSLMKQPSEISGKTNTATTGHVMVDPDSTTTSQRSGANKPMFKDLLSSHKPISTSYFTHKENTDNPWFKKPGIKQLQPSPSNTTAPPSYPITKASSLWIEQCKSPVQAISPIIPTQTTSIWQCSSSPSVLSLSRSDSLVSQSCFDYSIDVSGACTPAYLCQTSSANVSFDIVDSTDRYQEQQHWSIRGKSTESPQRHPKSSTPVWIKSQSSPVTRQSSVLDIQTAKTTTRHNSIIKTASISAFQQQTTTSSSNNTIIPQQFNRTVLPINTSWKA